MGDRGRPLERLIDQQRQELGENLETLAEKARAVTDWRVQVDERPLQMVGLAVGGGAILGLLLGGRRASRSLRSPRPAVVEGPRRRSAVGLLARDIQLAIGGAAASAAIELLAESIPGFASHFQRSAAG